MRVFDVNSNEKAPAACPSSMYWKKACSSIILLRRQLEVVCECACHLHLALQYVYNTVRIRALNVKESLFQPCKGCARPHPITSCGGARKGSKRPSFLQSWPFRLCREIQCFKASVWIFAFYSGGCWKQLFLQAGRL